jgi:hypothetical protein
MTRGYANSWTSVRLPDADLAEVVLEVAAPLLRELGTGAPIAQAREVLALAVSFWNASVRASKRWERRQVKELNELKKQLRGQTCDGSATFEALSECFKPHWLDPRLVERWSYDEISTGARRLTCTMGLPDGVRAVVPPPADKRIAIEGVFLDEVRVRLDSTSSLSFPYARHIGTVAEDGTATVNAMMPAVLQLFAEGHLQPMDGREVDVNVGGRALGPMVLVEVRASGERYDVATLVFKPKSSPGGTA